MLDMAKLQILDREPEPQVILCDHDLSEEMLQHLSSQAILAVDLETTGLDAATDTLDLLQFYDGSHRAVFVRAPNKKSHRLAKLFRQASTRFVFHFARFDLAFIARALGDQAVPTNIACTKIATRLLHGAGVDATLKGTLKRELGISIEKPRRVRISNWGNTSLSGEQFEYAFNDVRWLIPLWNQLEVALHVSTKALLVSDAFQAARTLARADALAYPQLFEY